MGRFCGFTLIELITVIAILSILAAFAIPNVHAWKTGYELRSATMQLQQTLQRARLYAVRQHGKVIVNFDPNNDGQLEGEYIAFVDNGLDDQKFWTREADEKLLYQGRLNANVRFLKVSFAGGVPRLRFNTLGLPNGFGGHIYLTNGPNQFRGIHVNINGRSRIVSSRTGAHGTWE